MDPAEFQRRIAEAQALKAAQASAAAAAAAAAQQQQQQQQGQSQQRAVVSSPPLTTPTPSSAAESAGQQQHFMPSPSQHQQKQQGFPRSAVKGSEPSQDEAGNAVAAPQQQHQPASPPPGLDEAQQHAWQQYQEQYRQWQQQQRQWQQWQEYQQKQQKQQQQPQQQQPQQQQQQPQQQQQQPQQQQHHQPQQQQQRQLQHHQPQPQQQHHQQQSQPQPQQHQIFLGMQRTPMAVAASGARTPTPPSVSAPAPAPPTAAAVYGAPQPMVQPPQAVQHPPTTFMQPVTASAYQAIPPQNAFGVPPAYTPPTTFSTYGQQQQQPQQQQQQQPHNQHQHPPGPQQQQQLQQHQPPHQQPQLQQLPQHPPFVQQQPQQQPLLPQPLQHQPLQLPQQPQQQQQQPPVVMMPTVATPPMGFPGPQPVGQSGYGGPPPVQQMWGQPQSMPQQQPQQQQQPPQQQQHHQQLPLPPPQGFVQTPPGITPTPPPLDPKDAERVDKMADYVARNGGNFEEMVREREKDNRMLSFLFGGELHEYYKWALHCARMGFPAEQRHAQIGMYLQHKAIEAQGKTQAIQRMIEAGEMVHGANLAMDAQNEQQFELLLKQLVGSQDSIQASKDWVVSRLGHYAVTIAWRLRAFSKETESAAGGEGHRALPRNKACEKVIHVLYLVNDVLFAIRHHPAGDIFRAECLRQIPGVLKAACTLGPELTGGSLDKVERIVRLWDSNGVYTTAECNGLLAAAAGVTAKHASAKAMASKAARVLERAGGGGGANSSIIGGSGSLSVGTAGGSGAGTGTLSTDELKGATAEEVMERELARVKKMAEGGPANDGILGLGGVTAVTAATAALTLPSVPNVAPAPATMPACHVAFPWRGALYPVMGKTESQQQQQLNPATKFPVAAGLASTAHDAGNMLEKLPVGTMAGILRVSLRNGFRRYKPIDLKLLPKYAAPHIEPGRLDVRVDEFYSRATLKLAEEERQKEKERRKMEEDKKNKDGDNNRDRDRGRRNREAFAGGSGSQGLRAKQAQLELESDQQGREKVLGEENIGHNLLKKMGWSEGTGLGSTRSGVVEPISGAGQMDKAGIGEGGSAKKGTEATDAFEVYRRNKSYSYRRF